jgi:hypothetical protein
MRFSQLASDPVSPGDSFAVCLAAVLEGDPVELPPLDPLADPEAIVFANRWLGTRALGLARVADPATFSWPGPWIALVRPPTGPSRHVLMYGTPSGVIWDPAHPSQPASVLSDVDNAWIAEGYLVAVADIGLADLPTATRGDATGVVELILVSPGVGEPPQLLESARALPGRGLDGDRYVGGGGSFPSGVPGSALTLIESEVCRSFDPPLAPEDHRRNLVTRGVSLNNLLGRDFSIGTVRCRGMRLCEPCTVVQRYAGRPVLRALAHRGGLRADILSDGDIRLGDVITPLPEPTD